MHEPAGALKLKDVRSRTFARALISWVTGLANGRVWFQLAPLSRRLAGRFRQRLPLGSHWQPSNSCDAVSPELVSARGLPARWPATSL